MSAYKITKIIIMVIVAAIITIVRIWPVIARMI